MREFASEVLEKHQVRKTGAQKTRFIGYVKEVAASSGYSAHVERGAFGVRNIVVGDPSRARVVFSAHYDTCPVMPMPNFITPKRFDIYIMYQMVLLAVLLFLPCAAVFLGITALLQCGAIDESVAGNLLPFLVELCLISMVLLVMFGPANKHTANDNTSGVVTLISIMRDIAPEERTNAAFIFFDHEELGLLGSSSYRSKHKFMMRDKLLINFDCVSDGDHIMLVLRKGAIEYKDAIGLAYRDDGGLKVEVASKGVFYPSDQAVFRCGVGVAALKSTKDGVLYMDRIHTPRDTVFCEENIEYLTRSSLELVKILGENNVL